MLALSTSIQAQTKLMEKMQDSVEQSSSDKKEKFGDLHDSTKLLILNASSRNTEVTLIKPSLTCDIFFKKKSVSQSKQLLVESLSDAGCVVEIETGLVTAFVNGQFLCDREVMPSNFSIFLVPKRKSLSPSSFKSGMILRLKSLHAKWDEKDMQDAVKQGVACPISVDEMIRQLKNFAHLCAFFFTESFYAFRFLVTLIERVNSHLTVLESAKHRDNLFVTNFCFAFDTRFFRWMEQCKRVKDREDVNDQLLNFSTMLDSVLIDQFYQTLTSIMKLVSNTSSPSSSVGDNPKPSKKSKKNGDNEDRKVDNKKSVQNGFVKRAKIAG